MSVSNDPGHFFQTDASAAKAERRAAKRNNKNGDPIDLGSKLLAIIPDPLNPDRVYIAESGGYARRVVLETGDRSCTYRGHTAPVTSLALDSTAKTLFAGSWDKTIISWHTDTRRPLQTFTGHTDFVKSLLYIRTSDGTGLLLSGSADASIIIWNATTSSRIYALSGHNRGIGALALDPITSSPSLAVVYSGGSERDIKKWEILVEEPKRSIEVGEPMLEHDTSVNMIRFEGEDADMWTASADTTARRIDVRDEEKKVEGLRSDTVLRHPDYVNDVVVEPRGRWAVTACRDEEVRVWDVGTGELYHIYEGHSEDVMGLAIVGSKQDVVASVSTDGTIRRWSLKQADLMKAIEAKKEEIKEKEPVVDDKRESLLTIEEERELAELMEDDE